MIARGDGTDRPNDSGDAECSAAVALSKNREYLFLLRDRLRAKESYAAGGFIDTGPDMMRSIGGSDAIGGKRESGCKAEGFLRGQR